MDFNLEEKIKNIVIIILGLVALILSVFIFVVWSSKDEKVSEEPAVVEKEDIKEEVPVIEEYVVDIKGAVKKPGVYKIKKGSIVNDLIKMAGGLKSSASTSYINLSYELKNHDVINIFTKTEVKNNDIKEECKCDDIIINDCVNSGIITEGNNSSNTISGKVNINNATLDELLTINGIGESKAIAIIDYRKSNKFNSIEDIKNVSGIGDSLYNKIKEYITV